jgi:hypothetical protein
MTLISAIVVVLRDNEMHVDPLCFHLFGSLNMLDAGRRSCSLCVCSSPIVKLCDPFAHSSPRNDTMNPGRVNRTRQALRILNPPITWAVLIPHV